MDVLIDSCSDSDIEFQIDFKIKSRDLGQTPTQNLEHFPPLCSLLLSPAMQTCRIQRPQGRSVFPEFTKCVGLYWVPTPNPKPLPQTESGPAVCALAFAAEAIVASRSLLPSTLDMVAIPNPRYSCYSQAWTEPQTPPADGIRGGRARTDALSRSPFLDRGDRCYSIP